MTFVVYDPFTGEPNTMAASVYASDPLTHSQLLGPDGKPLRYQQPQKIGFDLRPTQKGDG